MLGKTSDKVNIPPLCTATGTSSLIEREMALSGGELRWIKMRTTRHSLYICRFSLSHDEKHQSERERSPSAGTWWWLLEQYVATGGGGTWEYLLGEESVNFPYSGNRSHLTCNNPPLHVQIKTCPRKSQFTTCRPMFIREECVVICSLRLCTCTLYLRSYLGPCIWRAPDRSAASGNDWTGQGHLYY